MSSQDTWPQLTGGRAGAGHQSELNARMLELLAMRSYADGVWHLVYVDVLVLLESKLSVASAPPTGRRALRPPNNGHNTHCAHAQTHQLILVTGLSGSRSPCFEGLLS